MSEKYTNRLLKIATNQITRELDLFAKKYDMTWMQMSVIDYLSRQSNTEIFQRDIEQEFFIQRSTATVLLQRMEKQSLLYRKSSLDDARQKSVYLTEKSRNLEQQINQFMKRRQEILVENFSTTEIATFEKILKFYIHGGEA
ncbi:MarR family winged helix-turn-helix transcriptional regulator [Companilactobacillus kimchiensis]|uniref:MarR family transcriptional regulator n=1 Tax=Companilactobacillus kimchiensis TaxID=993692 RepID=A0A0R2LJN2_9LACO|nr:MarR family transcriptional regulator [Companilactobacillus kimchiensis]KRN98308.1 MarR family transcriptional regulator [Companilactobacillus kimchiensis]